MKVVHISTVHSVFDSRIFHKEAKAALKARYEIILIAQHKEHSVVDGIRIISLSKPKNRMIRIFKLTWQAFFKALAQKADIYHIHDPELIYTALLMRLFDRRVVYDVHEDLPRQILSKYWIPKSVRGVVAKGAELMEWLAGKFMSGIVTATPAIAKRFPPDKTVVVQNFPLLAEFSFAEEIPYQERPMQVAYVGGITAIRGAVEMVRAMERLPEYLGARLALAGTFSPPELEATVRRLPGWKFVNFLGWQNRQAIGSLLANSRIGIVVFHPEPNHLEAQPNKLFEYMAAGIPVVASNFPLWRKIVEGEGCGLTVDPLNPQAIAEAIRWLLEHPKEAEEMGRRGRQAVLEKYNWDREAAKLLDLYRRLL